MDMLYVPAPPAAAAWNGSWYTQATANHIMTYAITINKQMPTKVGT
jgi:hypothetical protein